MKICIISDTHTYLDSAIKAIELAEEPDLFIHLGDYYSDAEKIHEITGIPYNAVRGNKDWHADAPDELIREFGGIRIMAVHGHRQDIDRNDKADVRDEKFLNLAKKARENKARIVLYGHDHLADRFYIDDVLFFNPGELVYGARQSTFGLLEIEGGDFSLRHVEV